MVLTHRQGEGSTTTKKPTLNISCIYGEQVGGAKVPGAKYTNNFSRTCKTLM